jgi:hypothetical protein
MRGNIKVEELPGLVGNCVAGGETEAEAPDFGSKGNNIFHRGRVFAGGEDGRRDLQPEVATGTELATQPIAGGEVAGVKAFMFEVGRGVCLARQEFYPALSTKATGATAGGEKCFLAAERGEESHAWPAFEDTLPLVKVESEFGVDSHGFLLSGFSGLP